MPEDTPPPEQTPPPTPGQVDLTDDSYAKKRVQGPAIALLITGILGALSSLANFFQSKEVSPEQTAMLEDMLGPEAVGQSIAMMEQMQGLYPVLGALGLCINGIAIFGALKMKNLENFMLSKVAAILVMIPFLNPCCVLGLPFGIWALVTLGNDQVKSHFK